VVVGVGVQADVVAVPCDVGTGVAAHGAAHVTLVAPRRGALLQGNGEGWRGLQVAALELRRVQFERR
jgi:hypothetical protein